MTPKKHSNQAIIYDGAKTWDLWNGDEGWTIHSGDGSQTTSDQYLGLVPVLFQAVTQRARAISNMPFALYDKSNDEFDTSRDWENKVDFLPNPRAFLYLTEAALCIAGRAYWLRRSNIAGYSKQPRYLLPGSVHLNDKVLPGTIEFIRKVNNVDKKFSVDDIIYFWALDPTVEIGPANNYPASVASHACGVLYNVDEFAENFFKHGAIKSMLLTVQGNPPAGEREKLETWWNRVVAGARNAWGAKVINAETVKPVVVGEGMKELENVTLTDEKRADIATAFDIPQTILFSSAANYATSVQDKRSWFEDSIVPECEFIAEIMNEQIFDALDLHFEFLPETLDIMQEDEAARATALSQLVPAMADPNFEIAAEVLGYELTDDQWALWRSLQDAKKKRAEAVAQQMSQQPAPQAGNGSQPPQETAQEAPQQANSPQAQEDMAKWRRKALKAMEQGKSPIVPFESDYINTSDRAAMELELARMANMMTLTHEIKRANDLLEHSSNGSHPGD